jgi:hypothetical protein
MQAGIVKLHNGLLFPLTLPLGLATRASDENIFLIISVQRLALGELLGSTLIGLAKVLGSERKLLFSQLSEVGSVRLALVLGLLLGGIFSSAFDIGRDTLGLLIFFGNGLACLLISQFLAAGVTAPAVSNLLLVVNDAGPAVAIASGSTTTSAATTTATVATSTISRLARFTGSTAAILVASYTTIPESILVVVVGSLVTAGSSTGSYSITDGSLGRGITLASPREGLINCLGWGFRFPEFWVLVRIVSEELVEVL